MATITDQLEHEKEYADHMAALAQYWMERAQQAERDYLRVIGALVKAGGGIIKVNRSDLEDTLSYELIREEDFQDNAMIYRIRKAG